MSTDAQSTQPLVTCQYGRAPHTLDDDCVGATPVTAPLADEVEQLRAEIKQLRAQLADITRGQGEVWPAGASLSAGPPLPRRVPGESLKPCGWMGIEPMTDPALEDRTEGSEP